MKVEVLEGLLHVMSPVVSGSDEHAGNHTDIRRITFSVDGAPVDIPVISGNSIRGQLRRLIMADMLERVGKIPAGLDLAEIEKMASQSKGFARLWHALCSGGMLEQVAEKDSGYVDLAMKRSIRLALPPVSVLGTAIGNQMIQGKIDVAIARPCCIELKDSVPAKFRPLCVQPTANWREPSSVPEKTTSTRSGRRATPPPRCSIPTTTSRRARSYTIGLRSSTATISSGRSLGG